METNWEQQFQQMIETTSSALKTSRVAKEKSGTAYTSWQRRPLTVTEVNQNRISNSSKEAWSTTAPDTENNTSENLQGQQSGGSSVAKQLVSQKLLLQDVTAVKSAVVQVAAEVGRHAQSTVETNNTIQRLGDNQEAQREMMSAMRQRVVNIETQRAQYAAMVADLRRSNEALRQQFSHLQSSINERATRGEVSASIQATVGPIRSQVESALQHYSEGLATATATAAAAVHAANDAKRRAISNRMTNSSISSMMHGGDPDLFRTRNTDGDESGSATNESMNGGGGSQHDQLMNSIDIIESRVERRMLRSIEDKIELELSRASDKNNIMNFDIGGSSNASGKSGTNIPMLKEWQLGLEGKVQECFQRVLEMGGKLSEESQRRHLSISAARAETRIEGKRIDELTATVMVAEKEMKETAILLKDRSSVVVSHDSNGGNNSDSNSSNNNSYTTDKVIGQIEQKVDQALQAFLTSKSFTSAVQNLINEEVESRVNKAVRYHIYIDLIS
jgi:hypothetical protein